VYQLSLNLIHCIGQGSYLILTRPYTLKKTNFQETTNECCIFIVAVLLFWLTDLEDTYTTKIKISWVIIFIIFGTVLFNICILVTTTIISIKEWIVEWMAKNKSKSKYEASTEMGD